MTGEPLLIAAVVVLDDRYPFVDFAVTACHAVVMSVNSRLPLRRISIFRAKEVPWSEQDRGSGAGVGSVAGDLDPAAAIQQLVEQTCQAWSTP